MTYLIVAGFAVELDEQEVEGLLENLADYRRRGATLKQPLYRWEGDERVENGWVWIGSEDSVAVVDQPPAGMGILQ